MTTSVAVRKVCCGGDCCPSSQPTATTTKIRERAEAAGHGLISRRSASQKLRPEAVVAVREVEVGIASRRVGGEDGGHHLLRLGAVTRLEQRARRASPTPTARPDARRRRRETPRAPPPHASGGEGSDRGRSARGARHRCRGSRVRRDRTPPAPAAAGSARRCRAPSRISASPPTSMSSTSWPYASAASLGEPGDRGRCPQRGESAAQRETVRVSGRRWPISRCRFTTSRPRPRPADGAGGGLPRTPGSTGASTICVTPIRNCGSSDR